MENQSPKAMAFWVFSWNRAYYRRRDITGCSSRRMGKPQMILLDTHIVVWLLLDPGRLSRAATRAIRDARRSSDGLAISSLTLFELAQLIARNHIQINVSLELFIQDIEARFVIKQVTGRIAAISAQLSTAYPNDPIDRMIGTTALAEGLVLVTADQKIRRSPDVQTIW
jgi:PIN domain nuclease of toxin-antitoxin system